jgi:hypothetical protein
MRLDTRVDVPEVDVYAQTVTDSVAALSLMLRGGMTVPNAWHDKPAPVEVRRDAYTRFQDASASAYMLALFLPEFAKVNQKPIIAGGPWNATSKALDLFSTAHVQIAEILAATAQVRLVGAPEPSEALRPVLRGLIAMYGSLPVGLREKARAAKRPEFERGQKEFTDGYLKFTQVCRVDLAYRRRPRRHGWELWRPKPQGKAAVGTGVPAVETEGEAVT